ncbi:hypothetical protein HETIRDRAFT_322848, partial [Heterobasidion irregulare TC 32-1]
VKCGQTDPSAAECPLVGCSQSGRDQPYLVIVGIFGTCLVLFGVSSKLPEYLFWTLAQVHAHHYFSLHIPSYLTPQHILYPPAMLDTLA